VPLFADVKRAFGSKAVQPFVQGSAGVNFTNANSKDAKFFYQYAGGEFKNGVFARVGGGLKFKVQKKLDLSLSAGYSYKTAAYKYAPFNGDPWWGQIQPISDEYRYNRWYAGVGIVW
jgi:hypothetical protein